MNNTDERERLNNKYNGTLHYLLSSLVPYTESNLKSVFMPHRFFNDLEKLHSISRSAAKNAYYRSIRSGDIVLDEAGVPKLTEKGRNKLNRYEPRYFKGDVRVVVIFDIPENLRSKRARLRTVLREFAFKPVQKSVWESRLDCMTYLEEEIKQVKLENYVVVYEAVRLNYT